MFNEPKAFTVRWPKYQLDRLKELHANTYPSHRLNFNRWLLAQVKKATEEEEFETNKNRPD